MRASIGLLLVHAALFASPANAQVDISQLAAASADARVTAMGRANGGGTTTPADILLNPAALAWLHGTRLAIGGTTIFGRTLPAGPSHETGSSLTTLGPLLVVGVHHFNRISAGGFLDRTVQALTFTIPNRVYADGSDPLPLSSFHVQGSPVSEARTALTRLGGAFGWELKENRFALGGEVHVTWLNLDAAMTLPLHYTGAWFDTFRQQVMRYDATAVMRQEVLPGRHGFGWTLAAVARPTAVAQLSFRHSEDARMTTTVKSTARVTSSLGDREPYIPRSNTEDLRIDIPNRDALGITLSFARRTVAAEVSRIQLRYLSRALERCEGSFESGCPVELRGKDMTVVQPVDVTELRAGYEERVRTPVGIVAARAGIVRGAPLMLVFTPRGFRQNAEVSSRMVNPTETMLTFGGGVSAGRTDVSVGVSVETFATRVVVSSTVRLGTFRSPEP